jgi:type IV pilus assembly protein PilZ
LDTVRVAELVAEFVPLNRRRVSGDPLLSVPELQRWSELRDLLAYAFGHKPPPLTDSSERPLRVPTQLKVRYGKDGATAILRNLSEGGLFVESQRPLDPGTPLQLELDPGDGETAIALEGVVVWCRELPNLDGPAGFGVRFRNLEAEEFAALIRVIERVLRELVGP